MKKNLMRKFSYVGLMTIMATPVVMASQADQAARSGTSTPAMQAAASEHDQKIMEIKAEISEIDGALKEKRARLTDIRAAAEKGKDSVRTLVDSMHSPARPRGLAEPSGKPTKSGGLFGGWNELQISNLWNWAEFLYNNKEYWKKQATLRAGERDAARTERNDLNTLLSEVFSLETEIFSLQQMRTDKCELLQSAMTSSLREQIAKLDGKLGERSNTVRAAARLAGIDVGSTGTVSGVTPQALEAKLRDKTTSKPVDNSEF